jgi:hypothetical protein
MVLVPSAGRRSDVSQQLIVKRATKLTAASSATDVGKQNLLHSRLPQNNRDEDHRTNSVGSAHVLHVQVSAKPEPVRSSKAKTTDLGSSQVNRKTGMNGSKKSGSQNSTTPTWNGDSAKQGVAHMHSAGTIRRPPRAKPAGPRRPAAIQEMPHRVA